MEFTAKFGLNDDVDFGVPYYDEDGEFCIFDTFAGEYR